MLNNLCYRLSKQQSGKRGISSVILNSDILQPGNSRLGDYKAKMAEYLKNRNASTLKQKAYSHPMDSKFHPINFSPYRQSELFYEFIGPEQVSAHYEPLSVARHFALTSIFSVGLVGYLMKINDLNWVLESTYTGLFYYTLQYFVFVEGVRYLLLYFYKPYS